MIYNFMDGFKEAVCILETKNGKIKYHNEAMKALVLEYRLAVSGENEVIFTQNWQELVKDILFGLSDSSKDACQLTKNFVSRCGHVVKFIIKGNYINAEKSEFYVTMEEALKFREEDLDLKTFCELVPGGLMVVEMDENFTAIYTNHAAYDMLGYTLEECEELYQHSVLKFIYPEDLERQMDNFWQQIREKGSFYMEGRLVRKDNTLLWVNFIGKYIKRSCGYDRLYCVYTDISASKSLLQKLSDEKQSMNLIIRDRENILENMEEGLVIIAEEHRKSLKIMYANLHFAEMLGYTLEQLEKMEGMYDLLYEKDVGRLKECILNKKDENCNNRLQNVRFYHSNGKLLWTNLKITLRKNMYDESCYYIGVCDVTERQKEQKELELSGLKQKIALRHTGLTYWEYDCINDIAYRSDESILQYGLEKVIENYTESMVRNGMIAPECIETFMEMHEKIKQGVPYQEEMIKLVNKEGRTHCTIVRYTTLLNEEGIPYVALGTAENVDAYAELSERFVSILNQNQICSWKYSVKERMISQIKGACKGKSGKVVILDVPESLCAEGKVHPDYQEAYCEMYRKIHEGVKEISSTGQIYDPRERQWKWFRINYTVIFDQQGEPVSAIGSAVDVDEEMKKEQHYGNLMLEQPAVSKNSIMSYTLNLTKNTMMNQDRNGQSMWASQVFQKVRERILEADIRQEFGTIFCCENLQKRFKEQEREAELEVQFRIKENKSSLVRITAQTMQHAKSCDIICLLQVEDIQEEMLSELLIKNMLDQQYDFVMCIFAKTNSYTMIKHMDKNGILPDSGVGNYEETMQDICLKYAFSDSSKMLINNLKLDNMVKELERKSIYEFTAQGEYPDGRPTVKKHQIFYMNKEKGLILYMRSDITKEIKSLTVLTEGKEKQVLFEEILYIESMANKCIITTKQDKFIISEKISDIEKKVEMHHMMRCHRCYIVNYYEIDYIQKYTAVMSNGDEISIGRNNLVDLRNKTVLLKSRKK